MKAGDRVVLASGDVTVVVRSGQERQTKGWWLDGEGDELPHSVRAMWDWDGEFDAAGFESRFCLCPVGQIDKLRSVPEAEPALANPKQAYGDRKVPLHLVPPALVIRAAHALGEGAGKYGPYNWRGAKVEALTYVGAIQRHLASWVDGEEIDPESTTGKHHLDGVAGSLAILLDALHGGFLIDNRPPPGPAPRMVLTPKEAT